MMSTISYTLEDLRKDVANIVTQIDRPVRAVIGINRGGIVPAAALAYALQDCEILSLNPSSVDSIRWVIDYVRNDPTENYVVMDDICDSGLTLIQTAKLLDYELTSILDHCDGSLSYACLIHNTEQKFTPDFCGHTIRRSEQPKWYQFFWEDFANLKETN
jgi:hypoxanthine phosphoribosyltransferase